MTGNDVVIYGPDNRPVDMARAKTSHDAASFNNDATRDWWPRYASADADLLPELRPIKARARDVQRNSGWVQGAGQGQIDSYIGRALRLVAMPDWEALGQPEEWAVDIARQIETRWKIYTEDRRFLMDAQERRTFGEMSAQAHWQWYLSGEVFGVFHWIPEAPRTWATAFEFVDPDRLCNPHNQSNTSKLRDGVEMGPRGEPIAYHIAKSHPGDFFYGEPQPQTWERLPRYTSFGRPIVIHAFRADRPGQSRGKPPITSIIESLRLLDKFEKAQAESAVVKSLYAAVLQSPFDPEVTDEAMGAAATGQDLKDLMPYQAARTEYNRARNLKLNGVQIPQLFPGEELKLHQSDATDDNFEEFVSVFLRRIAAATGSSYEQVARDYSKTNYSSARAALIEAWKFLNGLGGFMEAHYACQHYSAWLQEDLESGEYDLPAGVPGYAEAPTAWSACQWLGPGRGYIDPVKEAQAALMRIAGGLSTYQHECGSQGLFWKDVFRQRRQEQAFADDIGLELPSPREATQSSAATRAGEQAGDGEETEEESEGATQ